MEKLPEPTRWARVKRAIDSADAYPVWLGLIVLFVAGFAYLVAVWF